MNGGRGVPWPGRQCKGLPMFLSSSGSAFPTLLPSSLCLSLNASSFCGNSPELQHATRRPGTPVTRSRKSLAAEKRRPHRLRPRPFPVLVSLAPVEQGRETNSVSPALRGNLRTTQRAPSSPATPGSQDGRLDVLSV